MARLPPIYGRNREVSGLFSLSCTKVSPRNKNQQLSALEKQGNFVPTLHSCSTHPHTMASSETAEVYGRDASGTPMNSMEHMELQNFAYHLGSYSVAPETDKAEQGTREEAQLLMSLCSSRVSIDKAELDAISSSESDAPYHSDSSSSRRDSFAFICPSFSLENSEMTMRRLKHNDKIRRSTGASSTTTTGDEKEVGESEVLAPPMLLQRPLKVDDRDAYRLSTAAMARNLSRSVQKALDWRIETWMHSLSLSLVQKEREMTLEEASESEMRTLLQSSEAMLLTHLRTVKTHMQVTGAGTGFRVLPQRVEIQKEPAVKKRRVSNGSGEDFEYVYTATHELVFDGIVNLLTPAGPCEVSLEIPGTMEGSFVSNGSDRDILRSVCLNVDTEFLAVMIEKASRKLVREAVQATMKEPKEATPTPEEEVTVSVPGKAAEVFQTPPRKTASVQFTPAAVRASLITPRTVSDGTQSHHAQSRQFLLPIPDDFNNNSPCRISPQPNSPTFEATPSQFSLQTPKPDVMSAASALVSPPLTELVDYPEVPEVNVPSLPMLVEVACREYRND